ncbi:MAG: WYL domain-containing protein [Candidatus Omnitrophica bacterium]|nr:WYL domain-containing protein [Candidatus Omnitrophota bacterium]
MGERLVMDLETQKDFNEVEGRKPELLGISVAGVYSYEENRYDAYLEADLKEKLAPRIQNASLLIGFNIRRFDLAVLQPYLPFSVTPLPVLDIMEDVVKNLGHRLSLESLAQATITQYCLDDVKLTKELFDYGKIHGKLFATNRFGNEKLQIAVFWPERKRELSAITKMLAEACQKHLQVEIEYLSQSVATGESPQRLRCIDIYHFQEPYFEGFCHFRQDVRQFRIDRVLDVKPTWQRYTIPSGYIPTASAE